MEKLIKMGYFSALSVGVLSVVTFVMALFTPPISGPFAQNPIAYPFLNIIDRFPRDYFWMYAAMLLMLAYMIFATLLFYTTDQEKKVFAHLGMIFGTVAAVLLLTDYYIQVVMIQPGLLNGETAGMALLTQYNPHGLFIALEEIGYSLLTLSFLFYVPLFSEKTGTDKGIRAILTGAVVLSIGAFIAITALYGIRREYIFEVAIISIDFIALIPFAFLTAGRFKKVF